MKKGLKWMAGLLRHRRIGAIRSRVGGFPPGGEGAGLRLSGLLSRQ